MPMQQKKAIVPLQWQAEVVCSPNSSEIRRLWQPSDRVVQAYMHALLGTFIKVLDTSEYVHAEGVEVDS